MHVGTLTLYRRSSANDNVLVIVSGNPNTQKSGAQAYHSQPPFPLAFRRKFSMMMGRRCGDKLDEAGMPAYPEDGYLRLIVSELIYL